MKKLYLALIFSLFIQIVLVHAQQATLTGVITDAATGDGIPGVNVFVNKTTGVVSDIDGNYTIKMDAGTYTIVYKYIGYTEESRLVKLKAGEYKKIDLKMSEGTKMLDAVVVSAGKFEQKLSDVTVSMEIIRPDFIENNNILSLEEGLQKIPGVNIMDKQPSIRGGSGYSYGAGSRVLLLVDDIPMITGATGEARWDFAPLENIEQVEVIKGASSALYGSSALNGVINYRTAYPGPKPKTNVTSIMGVYGDPKRDAINWWGNYSPVYTGMRFMHSRQIGQLDVVVGGNLTSDNGYRENNNEERYRMNANLRYRDKKVEGLSYTLNMNYMKRIGNVYVLWLDGDSGVYKANPSYQSSFDNNSFTVYPGITWFVNDKTKHSFKSRVYSIRNRNNTNQTNFDDMYYAEYNLQKSYFDHSLTWSNGVAATYNESKSEIFGDLKHFGSNLGFFSQFDKKFNRLNVSIGARIEGYRIDHDDLDFKPVFRTGFSYSLAEKSFLRTSFGMGYRYPTIAERYTATNTGSLIVFPNDTLRPENGWSAELAWKQGFSVWGWNGYLDIAGFYTRYYDMIEFTFGYHNPDSVTLIGYPPTDPNFFLNWVGFRAENIRNSEISGFEVILTGTGNFLGQRASALLGYTYTNPIDLDANINDSLQSTGDNILKYRFYHSVKADFEIQFKKLIVGANFEYQSHIINIDKVFEDTIRTPNGDALYLDPAGTQPAMILPGLAEYREKFNKGFVLFDLRAGWEINENIRATFTIKNLFNREYMMRPGDVQAPRTFVVQLNIKV